MAIESGAAASEGRDVLNLDSGQNKLSTIHNRPFIAKNATKSSGRRQFLNRLPCRVLRCTRCQLDLELDAFALPMLKENRHDDRTCIECFSALVFQHRQTRTWTSSERYVELAKSENMEKLREVLKLLSTEGDFALIDCFRAVLERNLLESISDMYTYKMMDLISAGSYFVADTMYEKLKASAIEWVGPLQKLEEFGLKGKVLTWCSVCEKNLRLTAFTTKHQEEKIDHMRCCRECNISLFHYPQRVYPLQHAVGFTAQGRNLSSKLHKYVKDDDVLAIITLFHGSGQSWQELAGFCCSSITKGMTSNHLSQKLRNCIEQKSIAGEGDKPKMDRWVLAPEAQKRLVAFSAEAAHVVDHAWITNTSNSSGKSKARLFRHKEPLETMVGDKRPSAELDERGNASKRQKVGDDTASKQDLKQPAAALGEGEERGNASKRQKFSDDTASKQDLERPASALEEGGGASKRQSLPGMRNGQERGSAGERESWREGEGGGERGRERETRHAEGHRNTETRFDEHSSTRNACPHDFGWGNCVQCKDKIHPVHGIKFRHVEHGKRIADLGAAKDVDGSKVLLRYINNHADDFICNNVAMAFKVTFLKSQL